MQDGQAERIKEGGVQGCRGIGGGVQGEGWGDAVVQDGRGAGVQGYRIGECRGAEWRDGGVQDEGVQDGRMCRCRMKGWRCA